MSDIIAQLLDIPSESQTIEFKRLGEIKVVTKVIETIVAMTNTDGGRIVIGIDDPEKTKLTGFERIYGIEENQELYDEIMREAQRIIPPIGEISQVSDHVVPEVGKTVVIIHVPKATESFRSIKNHVYVRLKKGNKLLSPQEVIKMSYAKGFEKADKELVNVDFKLLETNTYRDWRAARGVQGRTIEDVLFKTGLARKNESNEMMPTRAAVLLFAEYPTNLMETKCTIRVLQYTGRLETIRETPNLVGSPVTIEGPLIELIAKAHDYVLTLLRNGIEMHSGFITKDITL